jgi:multidrug resistance efflux pump
LETARVDYRREERRLRIATRLFERGFEPRAKLDDAREDTARAEALVEAAQASLDLLQAELAGAESGVFVRSDPRQILQRADQLALRAPQVQAELAEATWSLAAAEAELQAEQQRVGRLEKDRVHSPIAGVIWRRDAAPGQPVRQDENVISIADRRKVFVEALVHQAFLDSIAPGDCVTVQLTGGPLRAGAVDSVHTPGPAHDEPTLALGLSERDLKSARVLIRFRESLDCDAELIGRHARVVIESRGCNPLLRALLWVANLVRA